MPALILGIGNRNRGDDAAGLLAASLIRERLAGSAARVIEVSGEAADLMDRWQDADTVFLLDAVCSGGQPGEVHRIDLFSAELPAGLFRCSTHGFGVAEAVRLARALGRLPQQLVLYGIEAAHFQPGTAPSQAVQAGALLAADLVIQTIQA